MNTQAQRRSFTYVELVAAIFILAIVLVPATQFLTDSMTHRRELERDRHMLQLAIQTLEEQMSVINAGFTTANQTGDFTAQGLPDIAYQVIRSDATADGGIPDLLMAITAQVWSDDNGNGALDANERKVALHTTMARSVEP